MSMQRLEILHICNIWILLRKIVIYHVYQGLIVVKARDSLKGSKNSVRLCQLFYMQSLKIVVFVPGLLIEF